MVEAQPLLAQETTATERETRREEGFVQRRLNAVGVNNVRKWKRTGKPLTFKEQTHTHTQTEREREENKTKKKTATKKTKRLRIRGSPASPVELTTCWRSEDTEKRERERGKGKQSAQEHKRLSGFVRLRFFFSDFARTILCVCVCVRLSLFFLCCGGGKAQGLRQHAEERRKRKRNTSN